MPLQYLHKILSSLTLGAFNFANSELIKGMQDLIDKGSNLLYVEWNKFKVHCNPFHFNKNNLIILFLYLTHFKLLFQTIYR